MRRAPPNRLSRLIALYGAEYRALSDEWVRTEIERPRPRLIFGAGRNGAVVCRAMRAAGLEPTAFIDATPGKIGQTLEDVPIIDPASAGALRDAIAIVSIFNPGVGYLTLADRLRKDGVETLPLFAFLWAYGGGELPFYFLDRPERLLEAEESIWWLAQRLVDQESFDVLCGHVEFRLGLRYEALPAWSADRMPPPFCSAFNLIDAGAFDGDTLLPQMGPERARVLRAIALEPDPNTFARLQANVRAAGQDVSQRVRLIQAAVDRQPGQRVFANDGNPGSAFSPTGIAVDTVSIDSIVEAELEEGAPLYIKYDVEGAEAEALRGSLETIERRRPFLSVAAYHRPADLWELPRIIADTCEGYRFMLRSHGADGADLNLYAMPPS